MVRKSNSISNAEHQLITAIAVAEKYSLSRSREGLCEWGKYFYQDECEDWSSSFERLIGIMIARDERGIYALLPEARTYIQYTIDNMFYGSEWYDEYYRRAENSAAHGLLCERLYGKNLCQHGMTNMQEIETMIEAMRLGENDRVLELGCGNGFITEYIQDRTAAEIVGIDYARRAIDRAAKRANRSGRRLEYCCADIGTFNAKGESYNAIIALDSLNFVSDIEDVIQSVQNGLTRNGRMGIFFTQAIQEHESRELLAQGGTRVGQALKNCNMESVVWDFTDNVSNYWQNNKELCEELKSMFVEEGNEFLYTVRVEECIGHLEAIRTNCIRRYFYLTHT